MSYGIKPTERAALAQLVSARKKPKSTPKKTLKYSRITEPVYCRVLVIEAVLRPGDESYEELLDRLREHGAAEVVDDFYVKTEFDETADVLFQRRLGFVHGRKVCP